jgi:hypothetical protein
VPDKPLRAVDVSHALTEIVAGVCDQQAVWSGDAITLEQVREITDVVSAYLRSVDHELVDAVTEEPAR